MREYLPVLIVGGIIGMFALVFLIAYLVARRKNVLENRERNMPDSEIIRRLLAYAKQIGRASCRERVCQYV